MTAHLTDDNEMTQSKQRRTAIWRYLSECWSTERKPPTLRAISRATGVSVSNTSYHLQRLVAMGYVRHDWDAGSLCYVVVVPLLPLVYEGDAVLFPVNATMRRTRRGCDVALHKNQVSL